MPYSLDGRVVGIMSACGTLDCRGHALRKGSFYENLARMYVGFGENHEKLRMDRSTSAAGV